LIETYIYDPISIPRLIDIAEKYYEKDEKLEKINREYELNDRQIKALLETADIKGVVKKCVDKSALRVIALEEKIKGKFEHLNRIRVINYRGPYIKQEIAKIAADEVRDLDIKPGSSIAISCGSTTMELAKNLETNSVDIKGVSIYPLVITMTAEMQEASPAGIISFLTRIIPGSRGYAVQFPKIEKDLVKATSRREVFAVDCDSLLEGAQNAKYMFTGIGSIGTDGVTYSFNALIKDLDLVKTIRKNLKAVGESCHQPFTIDGEFLISKNKLNLLRANLIYVDLKELQKKVTGREDVEIFALAGGKEKHESILAGLRAKIFNCLITDIEAAEYIVDNA
jgi:DNA-binding transcriptional regulator LsrR (DeoR family)